MNEHIRRLKGANMDIDLATPKGEIVWEQDGCPWNQAEHTNEHKCAVKNISICQYFRGGSIWIPCSVVIQKKVINRSNLRRLNQCYKYR